MSTHFVIEAWKAQRDSSLAQLEGDDSRFSVDSSRVLSVVDAIEQRRWREGRELFPWYHRAYDPERGRPTVGDCFEPKGVLSSIQSVERELARNSTKYPAEWTFWETLPDGSRRGHKHLEVTYRGGPCRLYSDEKGCWAMILDSPDAYKPHYDLSNLSKLMVDFQGRDLELHIERASLLMRHQSVLDGIRRVCLWSRQHGALVLTMMLH